MDYKYCMNNKRLVSLDILRIISMCMIITLHYISYSNINEGVIPISKIGIVNTVLRSICNVAVNCYVLISGYFCIHSKFKLSKVFKLVVEVFVYSFSIYIIMLLTNQLKFDVKTAIMNFFPTLTRQYWFVTTYIGVYIISPLLKIITDRISQMEHYTTIFIGFFMLVVYYNFFFFCDNLNFGGATGIVWFIYLYLCAIYIKKYYKAIGLKKELKKYFILVLLSLCSRIPFYIMYYLTKKPIFIEGSSIFDSVYNSIFTFLTSISIFKVFLNINCKLKESKILNTFAISSWYVYILHENKNIRNIIWKTINYKEIVSGSIIKYLICWLAVVLVIYVAGTIISNIVNKVLKTIFFNEKVFKRINYIQEKIYTKYKLFFERREKIEVKNK